MKEGKYALGLDVGTTTLSAAVIDLETGRAVKTQTIKNESVLPGRAPYERIQDASGILSKAEKWAAELAAEFALSSIGITGQMHGIVYMDAQGMPVSPLYTWQDERAGEKASSGVSYCEEIKQKTGYPIYPGYGWATHYYQMKNGQVPSQAAVLCTVMDALTMRLTGNKMPLLHPSNAASLGLFDVEKNCFQESSLRKLGMNPDKIPEIAEKEKPLGLYRGIPVSCALGDNQAAVYGALSQEEESVLVNIGTGSQVSLVTEKYVEIPGLETRPYIGGKYLLSGAALCGGKAYAMTEAFFRGYAAALGIQDEPQYALMQKLAEEAARQGDAPHVNTAFCGTRQDPSLRGSIQGIGEDNFTPGHLILGVLRGMAEELWAMYEKMPRQGRSILAASGNGVRKNPLMQKALQDRFHMPLLLPMHREEAAFGAALYGAFAAGLKDRSSIKRCIQYRTD